MVLLAAHHPEITPTALAMSGTRAKAVAVPIDGTECEAVGQVRTSRATTTPTVKPGDLVLSVTTDANWRDHQGGTTPPK